MLNGQYTPQWTVVCKKYTNYLITSEVYIVDVRWIVFAEYVLISALFKKILDQ